MIEITKDGKKFSVLKLEHMLHHSNLAGVLENGLLSHNEAYRRGLIKHDISMAEVQRIRATKRDTVHFRSIHDYVSMYFRTINPMLYKRKDMQHELLILLIDADIIKDENTIFTDGNAANAVTKFYKGIENLEKLPLDVILETRYWAGVPDGKRIVCAEVLAYPTVPREKIIGIICPNQSMLNHVLSLNDEPDIYERDDVKELKKSGWDVIAYKGQGIITRVDSGFFF
jgi:hypothetical protein